MMQTSLLAIRSLPTMLPYSVRPLISPSINQHRFYGIDVNGESNPIETKAASTAACISDDKQKLIKVAIIGVPNAGKSSFINQFIDRRVNTIEFV